MTYQPDKHHRQSIRLRYHDYSSPGAYFVTLCTHERKHLFGHIDKGQMVLNDCGNIAYDEWLNTPNVRPNVEDLRRGVLQYAPTNDLQYAPTVTQHIDDVKFQSPSQTVGAIIRGYKGAVTKRINVHRQTPGIPVWQRNYYERVVRNEDELNDIRIYIENNPNNEIFDGEAI